MTDIFDVTLSPLHPTVEEDHCAGLQSQLSTAFKVLFHSLGSTDLPFKAQERPYR